MSEEESLSRFTWHQGDLEVTSPGEENPHGYSYRFIDDKVVFYDDDGDPVVNPKNRPITEDDMDAAARAFKMDTRTAEYLERLAERHKDDPNFAGAVVAKAARRALKKVS